MSELRDLYQDVILEHARRPRNFREMEGEGKHRVEGFNPLCGDHFTVWLDVADGRVRDASFTGNGCAISTASASVMTELVKGRTQEDADALFERFHALVTGRDVPPAEDLGKLAVFAGVSEYPARVKCASLAWHALHAALADQGTVVSTE
jgi:nitrogen fixation NifU-like protein